MKVFFNLPDFDAQLLRALAYAYYEGAEIGECLTTAANIKEGDIDSWYNEWFRTAERIFQCAENSLKQNHHESAKEAYLRASNYFRTAYFFLYAYHQDPRLIEAYNKHVEAFEKAIDLFPISVQKIRIPFENTSLPAYFYKSNNSSSPRPIIISSTGYDGTQQEVYFTIVAAALRRGYHVLTFDGPGQGEMLFKQNIYMRPDWENVIKPVVDYALTLPEVDSQAIILYGASWGGYLAPRAAAFEHRLRALIANPGQVDALENLKKIIPQVENLIQQDENHVLEKYLNQILSYKMMALKFRSKMWVHGVSSPFELVKSWRDYTVLDSAKNIQCSTLVADPENEQFSQGQAKKLYDILTCDKEYILFKNSEGAGEHCESGAISLFHQKFFDWLGSLLPFKK